MFECTPPPAPLMQAVVEATRVASHYVRPLAVPTVCMSTMPEGVAAQATPGVVWFDRTNLMYRAPFRQWDRYYRGVVMHEVLHQYFAPYWDDEAVTLWDRETEEGIVSAVTLDLTPHLEKNLGVYTKRVAMGTHYIATDYRPFAARVYTHGWTGPRGRTWRAQLITADPSIRKEMVNAAP